MTNEAVRCPVALPKGVASPELRKFRTLVSKALRLAFDVDRHGAWSRDAYNKARNAADDASWACDAAYRVEISHVHSEIDAWLTLAKCKARANNAFVSLRDAKDRTRGLAMGSFVDMRIPENARAMRWLSVCEGEFEAAQVALDEAWKKIGDQGSKNS